MRVLHVRGSEGARRRFGPLARAGGFERFSGEGLLGDVIKRSPTETLVRAMEEVGEAVECLVIMTDSNGDIITLGSTTVLSTRLGLLEMAKTLMLKDIIHMTEVE